MFHLNVSLSLRDLKAEMQQFLELVNNTPGVKSGSGPPTLFAHNSSWFAWVKLESELNATKLAKVLQKAGFAAYVYDEKECEPIKEKVS